MKETIRFKVTFTLRAPGDFASYVVCSLNGEEKAKELATTKHGVSGTGHILSTLVEHLPGSKPEGGDLVDRMEW